MLKQLALISLAEGRDVRDDITRDRLLDLDADASKALEENIAAELGCEPWQVIVHKKSIKNPVYEAPEALDPERILFKLRDGSTVNMSSRPDLLSAKLPADERLHVIGPFELPIDLDRRERERRRRRLEQRIREIVVSSVT